MVNKGLMRPAISGGVRGPGVLVVQGFAEQIEARWWFGCCHVTRS